MTEPAAAQLRIAAEPVLPLAILTELRRLTDAVLFSPAFVTRKGQCNETAEDTASPSVRTNRAGKQTLAMELNAEEIVLLAQLMYSLIEAIEKEASNEQD